MRRFRPINILRGTLLALAILLGHVPFAATTAIAAEPKFATATFAGGCFWCTEADLEKAPGVVKAISGFAGGDQANPAYETVAAGKTKHVEAVQVSFDPKLISYQALLQYYWRHIDPTDGDGQFVDRGPQYRPVIFTHSAEQAKLATASKQQVATQFEKPLAVEIVPFTTFYPAEDYHQDYYKKSLVKYKYYRYRSGRDAFIEKHWSKPLPEDARYNKPAETELKAQLSPLEYKVTQEEGTEKPFDNAYWDNKAPGIYVDVVSKEPLFSSLDKFESGTGWPSFTKPLVDTYVVEKRDFKLIVPRTEVRSKLADSHLGHLFDDGPEPTGLRYCLNSAALEFIPKAKLVERGYGHYLAIFDEEVNASPAK